MQSIFEKKAALNDTFTNLLVFIIEGDHFLVRLVGVNLTSVDLVQFWEAPNLFFQVPQGTVQRYTMPGEQK